MDPSFKMKISLCSAHIQSRQDTLSWMVSQGDYMDSLVAISLNLQDPDHYKACWILELAIASQPNLMVPYQELLCQTLSEVRSESAKRPLSKIAFLLSSTPGISCTDSQQEQLIHASLNWLITDTKVATQCYALKIIDQLSAAFPEAVGLALDLIDTRYSSSTAAFQNRAYKFVQRHSLGKI